MAPINAHLAEILEAHHPVTPSRNPGGRILTLSNDFASESLAKGIDGDSIARLCGHLENAAVRGLDAPPSESRPVRREQYTSVYQTIKAADKAREVYSDAYFKAERALPESVHDMPPGTWTPARNQYHAMAPDLFAAANAASKQLRKTGRSILPNIEIDRMLTDKLRLQGVRGKDGAAVPERVAAEIQEIRDNIEESIAQIAYARTFLAGNTPDREARIRSLLATVNTSLYDTLKSVSSLQGDERPPERLYDENRQAAGLHNEWQVFEFTQRCRESLAEALVRLLQLDIVPLSPSHGTHYLLAAENVKKSLHECAEVLDFTDARDVNARFGSPLRSYSEMHEFVRDANRRSWVDGSPVSGEPAPALPPLHTETLQRYVENVVNAYAAAPSSPAAYEALKDAVLRHHFADTAENYRMAATALLRVYAGDDRAASDKAYSILKQLVATPYGTWPPERAWVQADTLLALLTHLAAGAHAPNRPDPYSLITYAQQHINAVDAERKPTICDGFHRAQFCEQLLRFAEDPRLKDEFGEHFGLGVARGVRIVANDETLPEATRSLTVLRALHLLNNPALQTFPRDNDAAREVLQAGTELLRDRNTSTRRPLGLSHRPQPVSETTSPIRFGAGYAEFSAGVFHDPAARRNALSAAVTHATDTLGR